MLKKKGMNPKYYPDAHNLMAIQLTEFENWHENRINNGDISEEEINFLLQQGFKMSDAVKYLATRMAAQNLNGMYYSQWPTPEPREPRGNFKRQNRFQQQRQYRPTYDRQPEYNNRQNQRYNQEDYRGQQNYNNEGANQNDGEMNGNQRFNNNGNRNSGLNMKPSPRKAAPGEPFYRSRKHDFGRNKTYPLDSRFTSINKQTGAVDYDYERAMQDADERYEKYQKNTRYWNPVPQNFENDYRGQFNDGTQQPAKN